MTPTGDLNSRLASDTSKVGDQVSLNVNVFARTGGAARDDARLHGAHVAAPLVGGVLRRAGDRRRDEALRQAGVGPLEEDAK